MTDLSYLNYNNSYGDEEEEYLWQLISWTISKTEMKVTEIKYLAMSLLAETKVNFVFPPDKFLTTVKK